MTSLKLLDLKWDTDFFGFRVARLEGCISSKSGADDILNPFWADGGKLVYYNRQIGNVGTSVPGVPVDHRVVFRLSAPRAEEAPILPPGDSIVPARSMTTQLERLAVDASRYSRFRLDRRMPAGSAERLYQTWMERSISGQFATATLVYMRSASALGVVTLQEHDSGLRIGLIGVDASFRGQGIGTALCNAAIRFAMEKGAAVLDIATQQDNRAACSLYRKMGFKLHEEALVYHIWAPNI